MRDGKEFHYLQLQIQMGADQRAFNRGALREGPRVHLAVDYDDEGMPGTFALLTERRVDLHGSRVSGIDAYEGRFVSGASIKVDLNDPLNPRSVTYGLIDGQYATPQMFEGMPLQGDLIMNSAKFDLVFQRLLSHFNAVRRK